MYVVRCFIFYFLASRSILFVARFYIFCICMDVWWIYGYGMNFTCKQQECIIIVLISIYIYIVISSILLNNKYQTYEQNKNNQNDKAKLCCMNFFLIWGAKGLKHTYVDGSYSDSGLCHSGNDGYELYMLPTPLSWPSHHNGITTKKPANHIQLAHKHKA